MANLRLRQQKTQRAIDAERTRQGERALTKELFPKLLEPTTVLQQKALKGVTITRLAAGSVDYRRVMRMVSRTVRLDTTFYHGAVFKLAQYKVKSIERVDNEALVLKQCEPPERLVQERWMWHGTHMHSAYAIAQNGYKAECSVRGAPGAVYLAARASTSLGYAFERHSTYGEGALILNRVVLGGENAVLDPVWYNQELLTNNGFLAVSGDRVYPAFVIRLVVESV